MKNKEQLLPEKRIDLRILQALRRIIRAIDLFSKRLSHSYHLTAPQLVCLSEIAENGPITSASLAKNVYLSPSTLVGIVDRLESKELITRERNKADRRQVALKITEAGEDVLLNAPSPLQDKLARALNSLPENDRNVILGALEQLVELMEAEEIDASPMLDTNKNL